MSSPLLTPVKPSTSQDCLVHDLVKPGYAVDSAGSVCCGYLEEKISSLFWRCFGCCAPGSNNPT